MRTAKAKPVSRIKRAVKQKKNIKAVILGSQSVGKTCICISYAENRFPGEYIPTVFDNYHVSQKVDGKTYDIDLKDTPSSSEYENLRVLNYTDTDVAILVFSVISQSSFLDISNYWINEIRTNLRGVPIILVGNKVDEVAEVTERFNADTISKSEGQRLSDEIGATKYIECSALTQEGLVDVFDEVCKVGN